MHRSDTSFRVALPFSDHFHFTPNKTAGSRLLCAAVSAVGNETLLVAALSPVSQ
jgi:hypothetical protein